MNNGYFTYVSPATFKQNPMSPRGIFGALHGITVAASGAAILKLEKTGLDTEIDSWSFYYEPPAQQLGIPMSQQGNDGVGAPPLWQDSFSLSMGNMAAKEALFRDVGTLPTPSFASSADRGDFIDTPMYLPPQFSAVENLVADELSMSASFAYTEQMDSLDSLVLPILFDSQNESGFISDSVTGITVQGGVFVCIENALYSDVTSLALTGFTFVEIERFTDGQKLSSIANGESVTPIDALNLIRP